MIKYTIGEVAFHLREPHDLEWLTSLGRVCRAFDQQDSGNIAFGVEKEGRRLFVKYAGARTMDYMGDPRDAVSRLEEAIPLYSVLEHPRLIRLIDHFRTAGGGYAAVFEWFEGECLHSHWSFAGAAKYSHPDSPFYRYRQLSLERRLRSLDAVFSFHVHVESQGYVAVDFYDGSILYDFANQETKICDIDFYRKAPSVNDMGESFWGAARSKAPEEFELGAPIDARTNVFTMGAIAFGLLGGETDRSFSKWEAGRPLYEVALRAVSLDRDSRFDSVRTFKACWDEARSRSRIP
ncbi:serine/threonine protein kinase [Cohnella xylanilytica]|uniref:Serine/threonine protein kinase n=1 Tax=Cohnella xylanilytica TaxID=557555 RepID=A0A841TWR8_9BACL|nr:serine/threonine protein kinase [Cohnella xylanilytica]MBB6690401.1 serine/threonine protein kinase [Cohnella xylanilytica]